MSDTLVSDKGHTHMKGQERSTITRRECRYRLSDPFLRPRSLGRIPRQKVIHSLIRRQSTNRREHAKRITSKHDDVPRMRAVRAHSRHYGIDEFRVEWVRDTGVLCYADVVESGVARCGVVYDILEYGPEARRGGVDCWLGGGC